MHFDPDNKIVQLCAKGMELEGEKNSEALQLFQQAWNEASGDLEKCIAAHYVARQQNSVAEKLQWDRTALDFALKLDDESIRGAYPSLYLNVAKCYEDLGDLQNARQHYEVALSHTGALSDDGYGQLIKTGIEGGLRRVK